MRGGGSPSCNDRLARTDERKRELLEWPDERRRLEGVFEALGKVAISEQVQAEKGGKGGEGPAGTRAIVEPLENQEGQQGRPDLNSEGVLGDSDEGLHLEVLFDSSSTVGVAK